MYMYIPFNIVINISVINMFLFCHLFLTKCYLVLSVTRFLSCLSDYTLFVTVNAGSKHCSIILETVC